MNTGALLIGLGAAILTAAYIAAPFRRRNAASPADLDALIERWVAQSEPRVEAAVQSPPPTSEEGPAQFCHHCGRRIQPDHRFCPGCGARLSEA